MNKIKNKNISYVGFLDDDCKIDKNWLLSMTSFINVHKCDIVGGPQLHEVKNNKYKNLYALLEPLNSNRQKVNWVATNNCFFKKEIIKKSNIKFNESLKNIGGSDQLFFGKLKMLGFSIMWNATATVKEYRQIERENFTWFLKRNFRYGYSGLTIDRSIHGNKLGFLINIFKIILLFFLSLLNLFFIFKKFNFIQTLFYLMRAAGRVFAVAGYKINKYQ